MDDLKSTVLHNIALDRNLPDLPWNARWESWPEGTYSLTPTDIGCVDCQYNAAGHRCVYGFDRNGGISLYMD